MRLLHTKTYKLKTFIHDVPPYAILSHTWGEEEVLFSHIHAPTGDVSVSSQLKGWQKITRCCRQAAKDGWNYVWIDTCCIDKSDPTELGEAINSMFQWYEEAEICYAYLADVPERYYNQSIRSDTVPWKWHFRSSRWFKRGWTLQELLAPSFLLFLDSSWAVLGSREEWASEIHAATRIEVRQLLNFRSCCLATKLSWAASRHTTRVEDRAYSLLGLLGVNMPLIYGEGGRAFTRLQHELIRTFNDETILAWGTKPQTGSVFSGTRGHDLGILATSPESFVHSTELVPWSFDKQRRGFTMTNGYLHINAELFDFPQENSELYAIHLNCAWAWPPLDAAKHPIILFLLKIEPRKHSSEEPPVLFRRAGTLLRHWGELSSTTWRSLGRHDILIKEQRGTGIRPLDLNYFVTFRSHDKGLIGRRSTSHYFLKDLTTDNWEQTAPLSSAPGSSTEVRISPNLAVVREVLISIKNGSVWGRFVIILKWSSRTLSFGIWEHESVIIGQEESMKGLLELDRDKPYPHSAAFPGDFIACVRVRPEPGNRIKAEKAFILKVTVENQNQEQHHIPLPLYQSPSRLALSMDSKNMQHEEKRE